MKDYKTTIWADGFHRWHARADFTQPLIAKLKTIKAAANTMINPITVFNPLFFIYPYSKVVDEQRFKVPKTLSKSDQNIII